MVTGEVLHALLDPGGTLFDDAVTAGIDPGLHPLARLPPQIWTRILKYLCCLDAANLIFATTKARRAPLDVQLPDQLFCFICGTYHHRLNPGQECLRPSMYSYPMFECPNARHRPLPRMRLVHGRQLPYSLIQLAMRAQRYGSQHGIPLTALCKRWDCRDSEWKHRSKVTAWKGHLILRMTSSSFVKAEMTPSEQRLLLFSRMDYAPYFSCCAHWAEGDLIRLVKCTLSHTPIPRQGIRSQMREGPTIKYERLRTPDYMPRMCDDCKPMRRCPQCPTEYLCELKLEEDKTKRGIDRFRHALVVTRWSDLGDGTSPSTLEWASCLGEREFDSFDAIKGLSLCSAFEAATSNFTPTQRLMSLGAISERKGSRGDVLTSVY